MSDDENTSVIDSRLTDDKRLSSKYWQTLRRMMQTDERYPDEPAEQTRAIDRAWVLAESMPLREAAEQVLATLDLPRRPTTEQRAAAERVASFLDAWESLRDRGPLIYALGLDKSDGPVELLASDLRTLLAALEGR